jgi:hypothetical protein
LAVSAIPKDKDSILFVFDTYFGFLSTLEFNKSLKVSYLKSLESSFLVFIKDFEKFKTLYFDIILRSIFQLFIFNQSSEKNQKKY